MDGAHVNDTAAALGVHVLEARPRRQECAVEMDREQPFPVRKFELIQRCDDLDSCVRNQNVNAAKALYDGLDASFHLALVGDIHRDGHRSEEHTSELQSLMRISYAVFCLKKKKNKETQTKQHNRYKCTTIT